MAAYLVLHLSGQLTLGDVEAFVQQARRKGAQSGEPVLHNGIDNGVFLRVQLSGVRKTLLPVTVPHNQAAFGRRNKGRAS